MKMKALFFALLVAVSSAAFGNDGPAMKVVSIKGSEIFKVIYQGTAAGKVKLSILDDQGQTLHSKTIDGKGGFILPVNFKGLTYGTYTIELLDDDGKYSEEVDFQPFSSLKSIHVSKLTNEAGKYLLAIANAQNESIRVRIYDERYREVYNESKVLSGDFAQIYKMENPFLRYTFEISDAAGNKKYFDF